MSSMYIQSGKLNNASKIWPQMFQESCIRCHFHKMPEWCNKDMRDVLLNCIILDRVL